MEKEFNTFKNVIRLPHKYAAGPTYTKFYNGLKESKILGTKCPSCAATFVPARSFCPKCHENLDTWVEVAQEGEVETWTYADHDFFGMPGKAPLVIALVKLDGTEGSFLHLIGGISMENADAVKKALKKGTRVKAVWNENKKGHMLDIKYFAPLSKTR